MELSWREVYDDAVARFGGQTPGVGLEAELVNAFEDRPAAVRAAVAKLADRFAAGKVHSPWPLVRAELADDERRAAVTASEAPERERLVHLAERRVQNLGHAIDSEGELLDELFGERSLLERHDTPELRKRMLAQWRRLRSPPIVWP